MTMQSSAEMTDTITAQDTATEQQSTSESWNVFTEECDEAAPMGRILPPPTLSSLLQNLSSSDDDSAPKPMAMIQPITVVTAAPLAPDAASPVTGDRERGYQFTFSDSNGEQIVEFAGLIRAESIPSDLFSDSDFLQPEEQDTSESLSISVSATETPSVNFSSSDSPSPLFISSPRCRSCLRRPERYSPNPHSICFTYPLSQSQYRLNAAATALTRLGDAVQSARTLATDELFHLLLPVFFLPAPLLCTEFSGVVPADVLIKIIPESPAVSLLLVALFNEVGPNELTDYFAVHGAPLLLCDAAISGDQSALYALTTFLLTTPGRTALS